jgi:hypothetical protein
MTHGKGKEVEPRPHVTRIDTGSLQPCSPSFVTTRTRNLHISPTASPSIAVVACDAEVFRPASFEGLEVPLAEQWDVPASWREE